MGGEERRPMFSDFIAGHRNGVADMDLTDALRKIAEVVARSEKPGSITLTIKITAKGDALMVADSLTVKLPNETEPRVYWLSLEGDLTRNNALQPQLPSMEDSNASNV